MIHRRLEGTRRHLHARENVGVVERPANFGKAQRLRRDVEGRHTSSILGNEVGVEEQIPEVIVRILKVARVSAPEGLLCLFDNACAGFRGLLHDSIGFLFARHVMADRELRRAVARLGEATVMCEIVASPGRKLEPALQLEERNCAVLGGGGW